MHLEPSPESLYWPYAAGCTWLLYPHWWEVRTGFPLYVTRSHRFRSHQRIIEVTSFSSWSSSSSSSAVLHFTLSVDCTFHWRETEVKSTFPSKTWESVKKCTESVHHTVFPFKKKRVKTIQPFARVVAALCYPPAMKWNEISLTGVWSGKYLLRIIGKCTIFLTSSATCNGILSDVMCVFCVPVL